MRISDWSSDVCSSDLAKLADPADCGGFRMAPEASMGGAMVAIGDRLPEAVRQHADHALYCAKETRRGGFVRYWPGLGSPITDRIRHMRERSEEHTSELQSLMRISYAVFCLKKKKNTNI